MAADDKMSLVSLALIICAFIFLAIPTEVTAEDEAVDLPDRKVSIQIPAGDDDRIGAILLLLFGLVVGSWLTYWFTGDSTKVPHTFFSKRAIHRNQSPTRLKERYLCFRAGGRLGNQMFGYASAFSIAKNKGMQLVSSTILRQYFILSSSFETDLDLWGNECAQMAILRENASTCNAVDSKMQKISGKKSLHISGCLRSWIYLTGHETEIRREFTFRDFIQKRARKALDGALQDHSIAGRVLVGVHVRRGDRLHIHALPVPEKSYFRKAMNFMRAKFKGAIFVVCSEDIGWAKEALFTSDTVFVDTGEAAVDFAVLTMCNHTIMSVGTFGWWAAWLANGTTIYYTHAFRPDTGSARHTVMKEYMPPHWIAMD
ncbi:galactoside alpha-(1,2)-fucosyltransferase 2-like [Liolophura sinensis]|uniref:galactoside alpha-(1,2)-fucosyltransferase 2-like n=1 Tax=Liolophura sinensis TaxID=3198878 RepID=UPI0031593B3F